MSAVAIVALCSGVLGAAGVLYGCVALIHAHLPVRDRNSADRLCEAQALANAAPVTSAIVKSGPQPSPKETP